MNGGDATVYCIIKYFPFLGALRSFALVALFLTSDGSESLLSLCKVLREQFAHSAL